MTKIRLGIKQIQFSYFVLLGWILVGCSTPKQFFPGGYKWRPKDIAEVTKDFPTKTTAIFSEEMVEEEIALYRIENQEEHQTGIQAIKPILQPIPTVSYVDKRVFLANDFVAKSADSLALKSIVFDETTEEPKQVSDLNLVFRLLIALGFIVLNLYASVGIGLTFYLLVHVLSGNFWLTVAAAEIIVGAITGSLAFSFFTYFTFEKSGLIPKMRPFWRIAIPLIVASLLTLMLISIYL